MHKDGDGPQVLELFAKPVEKVLRELIGDLRLAGHQHFAFHEYKDTISIPIFCCSISNDLYSISNVKKAFDIVHDINARYRIIMFDIE